MALDLVEARAEADLLAVPGLDLFLEDRFVQSVVQFALEEIGRDG